MARLQDFQTVTPTSSDKLLVVQSQGQGLVPYDSKLDSANPTGTGSLSLNRKSGTTTGSNSTTVGTDCEASGAVSFAEGYGTKASGIRSHASGSGTIASHEAQFVFGEYNVEDTTGTTTTRGQYVEIVGKGVSNNARSNARTLDWSGNEVLAGDLTIKGDISLYDATRVITPTDITFTLATGVNLSIETLSIRRLGKLNIINLTLLSSAVLAANTEIFAGTFSGLLTGYSYIVGSMVTANDTKFQGGYNLNTANGRLYICPTNSIPSGYKLSMTINALSA